MAQEPVTVYGTSWCPAYRMARRFLDEQQVDYRWIDVDEDPNGEAYVVELNQGNRSVPTIRFPDGTLLVEPSRSELVLKLGL
jgi:mycoredoxin